MDGNERKGALNPLNLPIGSDRLTTDVVLNFNCPVAVPNVVGWWLRYMCLIVVTPRNLLDLSMAITPLFGMSFFFALLLLLWFFFFFLPLR